MIVTVGVTDYTDYFYVTEDASSTNPGEPITGLLFSDIETGGSASYMRQGAVRVDFTLVTQTVAGAHTPGGFVEVDATNMPGVYRCDFPDAAFASGADFVVLQIVVESSNNAVASPIKIELLNMDLRDAVRGGMSALPNAAAEAAGGLFTRGTGPGQIQQQVNGQVDVNVQRLNNVAQSLLDLVDFVDAGYDPGTNQVNGVKLVDTTTASGDMRGTDAAFLAAVGGAIDDAAADGDPTAVDTLVQYIKQLVNVLVGSDGVTTFPAAAAPGNAVSLAQVLRSVYDDTNELQADDVPGLIAALPTGSENADAVWDEVLTGGSHNVPDSAGRRLRDLQEFGTYEGGAVWIDTLNGAGGTTDYESGTVFNPVNNINDANTLATSLGLTKFRVAPGSSITFVAGQDGQVFEGLGWTLALGGQSIVGTTIVGATVSGVAAGVGTTQRFIQCLLNATSHIKGTRLISCEFLATQTIVEAGAFFTDGCHSGVVGAGAPVWDFGGALNASTLHMRRYSGGIEIANMGAGTGSYDMSLEGWGQLIIAASCSATSAASIRGHFTVTDNAGGAVTLSDDARVDQAQLLAALTTDDVKWQGADIAAILADLANGTDGLTALKAAIDLIQVDTDDIQTRLPASLVGGRIDADVAVMQNGIIAALTFAAGAIDAAAVATDAINEIRDSMLSDSTPFAGANIDALISANATPAEVLTQVNAALDAAITELSQGKPTSTPSLRQAVMLLQMALRNAIIVDTTGPDELQISNDAGTVIAKKVLTDDGTIYTEAEMVSGP
jgi:hypothetical protein